MQFEALIDTLISVVTLADCTRAGAVLVVVKFVSVLGNFWARAFSRKISVFTLCIVDMYFTTVY